MESLKIYEINANYIDYLLPFAPHLFHNSKKGQANSRKYIGVLLQVHGFDYFAPLSSFKPKHEKMKEGLDFIKIKHYSVINLNNMFPAPKTEYSYVDFSIIRNQPYRSLLLSEYRFIKSISHKICKNSVRQQKGRSSPCGLSFCAEKRHRPKTVPFCHFLRNVQQPRRIRNTYTCWLPYAARRGSRGEQQRSGSPRAASRCADAA